MSYRARGRTPTAVARQPRSRRIRFVCPPGKGPQALEDLPGHWRAHRRAAGLGQGVWHHRLPYIARSQADFDIRAKSLPGAPHPMNFRAVRRAVTLAFSLALVFFRFWQIRIRGPLTMDQKARWSQSASRTILDALGIDYQVIGQPPARGLVVSNHLSYLDI